MEPLTVPALFELIRQSQYSYFRLSNLIGDQTFRETTKEEAKDLDQLRIINQLEIMFQNFPSGNYKIELKKSAEGQTNKTITYPFKIEKVVEKQEQPAQQSNPLQGVGLISLSDVDKKIESALEKQRIEFTKDNEISELKREISDLKNGSGNNQDAIIERAIETGQMLTAVIVSECAPNSRHIIDKMLDFEGEEEIEQKPKKVDRTD